MNRDFVDLLRAFSAAEVRFLVVGAFAVGRYAQPRATGDLDLWLDATPANAARVHAALREFGAPLESLREEELSVPDLVFQMGVAPGRIDLLTSLTGIRFADAWERREQGELGGVSVPFIGREDLVRNKRSLGRPRDLADVAELEGH
jgi:hypothetical protein